MQVFYFLQFLTSPILNPSGFIEKLPSFCLYLFSSLQHVIYFIFSYFSYLFHSKRCHYVLSEKDQKISPTAYVILSVLPSALKVQFSQGLHMVLKASLFFLLFLNCKCIFLKLWSS